MSTATILPAPSTGSGFVRPEVRRPARRPAVARGPVARPTGSVPAPTLRAARRPPVQSCRVEAPAAAPWRLTDRGIAVVLVLALMITVAAVTVIGLTAWRVTGTDYPAGSTAVVSSL